jgi:WD40 repeat protein
MKKSLPFLIAICSLCVIGCGGGTTTPPPVATHFSVTPVANTATAGTAFNFAVTALDSAGVVVSSYTGTVHFTSSDGQAALPADAALTNGTGSYSATLKTAGGQTITATAGIVGTSGSIAVVAAPASQLSVSAPAAATARVTFSFNVSALDPYNNPATSYAGTVHFTSSDAKAVLPANSPLPGGAGNFFATAESSGNQNITATDTVTGLLTGKSAPIATTAPATLAITSGVPPNGTVDQIYGGLRRKYEACALTGCSPCTRPMPPLPGTCPAWPPCGSKPCILELNLTGFTLNATGGVPPYGWNASSLPPGLGLMQETVEFDISGTPPVGSNGTYSGVQVSVHDAGNPPANLPATYTIVVSNPASPVVNTDFPPSAGAINQPYSFKFLGTSGALPLQNWKETGALPAGIFPLTSGGVLSGTPTATGSFPISVTVQDAAGQTSAAQNFTVSIYPHGFSATGSMSTVRSGSTATLLGDGKVLVAGGADASGNPLATAELFDPATGIFSVTGSMGTARYNHAAVLLKDGRVLASGGTDGNIDLVSAELYDPATGNFSATTGTLGTARNSHTATLLNSNKVLILGGLDVRGNLVSTAELYDPVAGTFTATGSLLTPRQSYGISLLGNGKVLLAGGYNSVSPSPATAELYDPVAGTFSATGSMASARVQPTATLLNTGKVLLAGGTAAMGDSVAIAELYDPAAGTFAATGSMVAPRAIHTAILLTDGTVLLAGGEFLAPGSYYIGLSSAEIFDPTTGTFSATGSMATDRSSPIGNLLKDGRVLVTGGYSLYPRTYLASSELYQ